MPGVHYLHLNGPLFPASRSGNITTLDASERRALLSYGIFGSAFNRLTHLNLFNPVVKTQAGDWSNLFTSATFPTLQHLSVTFTFDAWTDTASFIRAIGSVAANLKAFSFEAENVDAIPDLSLLWDKFDNLQHLHLSVWYDNVDHIVPLLRNLSSASLVSLSFGTTVKCHNAFLMALRILPHLRDNRAPFEKLKTLKMLGWLVGDFSLADRENGHDAYVELKELMGARGATLEVGARTSTGSEPAWEVYDSLWCASRPRPASKPLAHFFLLTQMIVRRLEKVSTCCTIPLSASEH